MLAPDEVAAMVRLHRLGWGTKRVAGELGCSRNTVKRYLAAGGWVAIRKPRRKRRLDGLEGWLAERFRRHRGNCDVVRQELLREHSITVSLRAVASPGGARPRRFRLCRPALARSAAGSRARHVPMGGTWRSAAAVGPARGRQDASRHRARRAAIREGYSVLFVTAPALVAALAKAHVEGRLEERLGFFAKPKLLIIDELGYLPFETNAAHLFFQLISRRYERGSVLIASNRSVGEWGSVFGDAVVATAILDRLLHHSHVVTIRGDSYRVREKRRSGLIKTAALPEQTLA